MNILALLSPAKNQATIELAPDLPNSTPNFPAQTQELIQLLQPLSIKELGELMHISEKLAELNTARLQELNPYQPIHAQQALATFSGDVYTALDAASLTTPQLIYLQNHLLIISGLYGFLKPGDLIQQHRLEMKTLLVNHAGKNLYLFWKKILTEAINELILQKQYNIILNCASKEYASAINFNALRAPVVDCQFKQLKEDKLKTIGIYAKKARGLMARYLAIAQPNTEAEIQEFNLDGYAFDKSMSDSKCWVFIKKIVKKESSNE